MDQGFVRVVHCSGNPDSVGGATGTLIFNREAGGNIASITAIDETGKQVTVWVNGFQIGTVALTAGATAGDSM